MKYCVILNKFPRKFYVLEKYWGGILEIFKVIIGENAIFAANFEQNLKVKVQYGKTF